jgi:hypothetical protein
MKKEFLKVGDLRIKVAKIVWYEKIPTTRDDKYCIKIKLIDKTEKIQYFDNEAEVDEVVGKLDGILIF